MAAFESVAGELRTLNDFVRWGASEFNRARLCFGHGTDNATDEALALVLHAVSLNHELAPEFLQARLTHAEKQEIYTLMQRRVEARVPLAYLTHEARFAGLSFYVDERVLIPRSPIAELIEQRFEPWLDAARVRQILDIGTGSGCIAVACAEAFPEAHVDAADNSPEALEVAKRNVQRYSLETRVRLYRSDLFADLPATCYDLIVSNPPYVPAGEVAALPAEYHHEPRQGLAGGADGLDIAARILDVAGEYLNQDGVLVLEVGAGQAALEARFPDLPFIWPDLTHGGEGVCVIGAAELRKKAKGEG
jgi:ribosomal protein L3 glutamine methyltransferase